MKKYILSIALIVFSLSSFAQPSEYHCYKTMLGNWDRINKKWVFEQPKSSTLTLSFDRKIVSVNDEAQSRYESISGAKEEENSNYNTSSWDGIDEKGRRIIMQLVKYHESGELLYMVIYDAVIFVYYINKSGLSPFN
jgi:hypothetical protein